MPLIKDGRLSDDPSTVPGLEMVDLARWSDQREALLQGNRPLGLSVKPDDAIDDIASDLDRFQVVALEFPAFTDGRAYSQARLVRERHDRELRAVGIAALRLRCLRTTSLGRRTRIPRFHRRSRLLPGAPGSRAPRLSGRAARGR